MRHLLHVALLLFALSVGTAAAAAIAPISDSSNSAAAAGEKSAIVTSTSTVGERLARLAIDHEYEAETSCECWTCAAVRQTRGCNLCAARATHLSDPISVPAACQRR